MWVGAPAPRRPRQAAAQAQPPPCRAGPHGSPRAAGPAGAAGQGGGCTTVGGDQGWLPSTTSCLHRGGGALQPFSLCPRLFLAQSPSAHRAEVSVHSLPQGVGGARSRSWAPHVVVYFPRAASPACGPRTAHAAQKTRPRVSPRSPRACYFAYVYGVFRWAARPGLTRGNKTPSVPATRGAWCVGLALLSDQCSRVVASLDCPLAPEAGRSMGPMATGCSCWLVPSLASRGP